MINRFDCYDFKIELLPMSCVYVCMCMCAGALQRAHVLLDFVPAAARGSIGCNTLEEPKSACAHCRRLKQHAMQRTKFCNLRGATAAVNTLRQGASRITNCLHAASHRPCDTKLRRLSARLEAGVVAGKHSNLAATNYHYAHDEMTLMNCLNVFKHCESKNGPRAYVSP